MYKRAKSWASLFKGNKSDLEPCPLGLLLTPWFSQTLRKFSRTLRKTVWNHRPIPSLWFYKLGRWSPDGEHCRGQCKAFENDIVRLRTRAPWFLGTLLASHHVDHPDFVSLFDKLGSRTDLTHQTIAAFTARNIIVWQDTHVSISCNKQIRGLISRH